MARIKYIPNRVIDSNGISDGASIYVYEEGTTTPVSIFSDSGFSTPLANPYVVAAGAAVPDIYHNFSGNVRVRVVEDSGTVALDEDPYGQPVYSDDLAANTGAAGIGTSRGGTVESELTSLDADVGALESDLSAVAALSAEYDGAAPLEVVESDSTANLADPSAADVGAGSDAAPAIGTTTANQIHRLRNNGTGLLSAQSSSALGTFAVTRKIDVTAGTQYTFSLHNCPLGWSIYSASVSLNRIQYFNSDGSFHSESSSFTADSALAREVTFTVPSGAEKVAFDLRNASDFSNDNPLTTEAMQIVQDNLMLNTGSDAATFSPYTSSAYTAATSRFAGDDDGTIRITKQGDFLYITTACQLSTNYDVTWRVLYGHGLNYSAVDSRSGVVDFYGQRFVPKGSTVFPSAFNQSALVHTSGGDESCPERRNGMFVDGGHGSTCYQVTKASHGMANVDVGSIWSDGTDNWLLLYIEDSDTLVFQRRYTGTDTKWNISSAAPGSSTFTHVSGATTTGNIAFTSPTLYQFVPIVDGYTSRLVVDGTAVTADGTYYGDRFWIDELYLGLNIAKVQDALIADVGNSSPDWTPDVPQVRRYNRYEWNEYGAMTVYGSHFTVDAYTRSAGIDYFGGIQLQRLSLTGDSTPGMHDAVELYIPDVGTVGSYTFKNKADITSNAAVVDIVAADCDDPTDLPSMFCLLGKASGSYNSGHAFGYDPEVGIAVPATRAASVNYVYNFSAAEKNYPKLIDSEAGDAAADDTFEYDAYRAPFLPTDADLTIPGVIYHSRGRARCLIAAHKTLSAKAVSVPAKYSGYAVSILRGSGMTLDSNYVKEGKITVSVSGSHGWAVLALG